MADLHYFSVATRGGHRTRRSVCSRCGRSATGYLQRGMVNSSAIEDSCSHDGSSFDQTDLEGSEIFCPRHGAVFDVKNRCCTGVPRPPWPVDTFPVRLEGDTIQVRDRAVTLSLAVSDRLHGRFTIGAYASKQLKDGASGSKKVCEVTLDV